MPASLPKASHLGSKRHARDLPAPQMGSFEQLSPAHQAFEVSRARAVLEAAEVADIKLSAVAVAQLLGYEPASQFRATVEKIKAALPGIRSDRQKFGKVIDTLHQTASWEDQERNVQAELHAWFSGLSEEQRESVVLSPQSAGDPILSSWNLEVTDGSDESFPVGHMVEVPGMVLAHLSPGQRADLEQRRKFWNRVGLQQGPAIEAFIPDHFQQEELVPDSPVPKEVEWLVAQDPAIGTFIDELLAQGAAVSLLRCSQTPDSVLDSIRHIAVKSQHKYVTTWLPYLLQSDVQPKVLDRDLAAIAQAYDTLNQATDRMTSEGGFRRKLLTEMFERRMADDLDFAASVDLIQAFKDKVVGLQVRGPVTPDQARQLSGVNQVLAQGLGVEYARRRLVQDDANRTSEKAQAIIKVLAVIGPLSVVVQDVAHLGGVAKFLAASGDDVAGGAAEMSALKGAGVSSDEILKRVGVLAPVAVAAFFIAGAVDKVQKTVNPRLAGAMFSSAAVLLSAATGLISIKYFADSYLRLAAEGKLPGEIPADPKFLEQLKESCAIPASPKMKSSPPSIRRLMQPDFTAWNTSTSWPKSAIRHRHQNFTSCWPPAIHRVHASAMSRDCGKPAASIRRDWA